MIGASARLLEDLLGRSAEDYEREVGLGDDSNGLILYGAGNAGREILRQLREAGIEPLAFADDTPAKQGTVIDRLEVLAPEAAAARFGPKVVIAVTILNPALRFLEARQRLQKRVGCRIVSLFALARTYPEALLPLLHYDRASAVLENVARIKRAFELFADDRSRADFVAHLKFRLTTDYDALPAKSRPPYFPSDLIETFPNDVLFIDCGAYDGDTLGEFLAFQDGQFGAVIAFEPDERNYQKLTAYVQSLPSEIASRIKLQRAAVSDRSGFAAFNDTGDMSATLAAQGSGKKVSVFALDDVVAQCPSHTYIKLDVEGYELQALHGAGLLLAKTRPTLAVSVYHHPRDLWEIPLYLHKLGLGYRLALRTEGDDGMDIVCYALSGNQPSARVA
jgi:FkbM family methyltransferase